MVEDLSDSSPKPRVKQALNRIKAPTKMKEIFDLCINFTKLKRVESATKGWRGCQ